MCLVVWLDSWQQQCCGEGFETGSTVRLSVDRTPDAARQWVGLLLGERWAARITHQENHHVDGTAWIAGTVLSIREVTSRRRLEECGSGETWVTVEGSGTLREVFGIDPWGPEPGPGPVVRVRGAFNGWIVELAPADEVTAPIQT